MLSLLYWDVLKMCDGGDGGGGGGEAGNAGAANPGMGAAAAAVDAAAEAAAAADVAAAVDPNISVTPANQAMANVTATETAEAAAAAAAVSESMGFDDPSDVGSIESPGPGSAAQAAAQEADDSMGGGVGTETLRGQSSRLGRGSGIRGTTSGGTVSMPDEPNDPISDDPSPTTAESVALANEIASLMRGDHHEQVEYGRGLATPTSYEDQQQGQTMAGNIGDMVSQPGGRGYNPFGGAFGVPVSARPPAPGYTTAETVVDTLAAPLSGMTAHPLGFADVVAPESGVVMGTVAAPQPSLTDPVTAELTEAGRSAFNAPVGTVTHGFALGQGRHSPGVELGVLSERGTATPAQVAALNYPDPQYGYAINNPAPVMGTPQYDAAIQASQVAHDLNPQLSGAISMIGMMAMPTPMSAAISVMQSQVQPTNLAVFSQQPHSMPAAPSQGGLFGAIAEEMGIIGDTDSEGSGIGQHGDALDSLFATALDTVADIATTGVETVMGGIEGLLDATVGAGFNAVQEGLDSIGLGSSATPESMAADAVAEAGAVGGEPEVPVGRQPLIRVIPDRDDERRAVIAGTVEAGAVDSFLGDVETQPLLPIPDFTLGASDPVLGDLEDLGVTSTLSPVSRGSSFRRSRITSPRDRAFGAANLFRPTLSAGISL